VRNAVESVASSGELTVRTVRNERGVELTVRDTGPGIDPDVLEDIFSPFFTTKSDGTGLGLAVTQKIVADHGGSIHVASGLGKGSAFTVALPYEQGGEGT
jgi:two-component system NtrC family sensor kinase